MTVDLDNFTPVASLFGGVAVGIAAWILLLFCGRVAGISGIIAGLLSRDCMDKNWRMAFISGMVASPWLYQIFLPLPEVQISASWSTLGAAGLLVGIGTRYASGCTSGHAVCGLSRLSFRSLIATFLFVSMAVLTVWVMDKFN